MQRHVYAARILPGMNEAYEALLNDRMPVIRALLSQSNVSNFSLWTAGDLVFAYCETADDTRLLPAFAELHEQMKALASPLCDGEHPMRLMYEDPGLLHTSKEHIRHRVFMTKLVPGAEEEYKRRHDALKASREGLPPGPDSNFTIWSAAGYIFGYDEIDTTMEHPMTEEERASTIAWETRMLEIMSWITDDVDWITGMSHPHIRCLAAYDGAPCSEQP